MLRRARTTVPIVLAITGLVLVIALGVRLDRTSQALAGSFESTPMEVASTLRRCGLGPEVLAAAGVNAAATTDVVADFSAAYAIEKGDLLIADAAVGTWKPEVTRLERKIQAGKAEEGDVAALAAARVSLANAESDRAAVLADLRTAAEADLTQAQRDALAAIRDSAFPRLPTRFQVATWTEAEYVSLRDVLAIERIAEDRGESPDPQAAAILADFESTPAVVTAAAQLDLLLPAVASAWDTATGIN